MKEVLRLSVSTGLRTVESFARHTILDVPHTRGCIADKESDDPTVLALATEAAKRKGFHEQSSTKWHLYVNALANGYRRLSTTLSRTVQTGSVGSTSAYAYVVFFFFVGSSTHAHARWTYMGGAGHRNDYCAENESQIKRTMSEHDPKGN